MAEENVARVGIALDSAAFQDGVSRALRDIDRLLSGLKTLQNANRQISLAAGGGMFGSGSKSPVSNFARDINRNAIPALRDMERNAIRVGGAVRRSMAEIGRLSSAAEQAQIRQERAAITAQRRAMNTSSRRGRFARDEGLFGTVPSSPSTPSFADPRNGGQLAARYVLRSLQELITSEAESYPRIMQPRPRGGGGRQASSVSQETVQSVATNFKAGEIFNTSPNLEEGLPVTIVGPNGERFVISGNGRVMGIRQRVAAPQGRVSIVTAVEGFITANPSLFGGSEGVESALAQVSKMVKAKQTPMLTRELVSTMAEIGERESGKLGLGLNTKTLMSQPEIAMAVSKLLQRPPTGLSRGTPGKILSGGGEAVKEFIGQVLEVLPPKLVQSTYRTAEGGANKQFSQLLEGVAMASAYGNNPATESMITKLLEGGKSGLPPEIEGALRRNLGPQLTLRGRIASGAIPAEMDPIYNNLPQAIELLSAAKRSYGSKFTPEQIGTQQGMEPASPEALTLAQAMRKAGSAGLPAFFEAIAQYGQRAVSATAPTLGLDPSAFVADPSSAIKIASAAAQKFNETRAAEAKAKAAAVAAGKRPVAAIKPELLTQRVVEEAISQIATTEEIKSVAESASKKGTAKVKKAVEQKVEQVAEVVAEAVADPRATSMRRPESQRFFKVEPRAIGTAKGSQVIRAGGYLPYEEASEAQQGKYNTALLGGYAEIEKQYKEAQAEAEYMKQNFERKPGAAPHASVQRVTAMAAELTRLKAIMIERGLAQPTMAEQISELFHGPTSGSPALTPTRTSGGGSGGGGGGRRRTTSSGGGGGGGEEPKVPKWIENFEKAIAVAGFDPQSLQYLNESFKFKNTAGMVETGLHGQSRASLGALQQYAAVRQLGFMQMSRHPVGGGANGFWAPGTPGEEGGIGLGNLGAKTAAPLLRTFVHEIAHGTFNALLASGYKPQSKIEMFGPKGEALGPTGAAALLSRHRESTASGHVDPAFYRSQAMISKAGGALLPQLAFHRMVEELMPQGHATQGIGLGKFSQLLTPQLKEFASPEQSRAAEEFVKFSARILEATSNFTQGSIGKGGALHIMSEGMQQLGASSKAFPSTFFLEATSVVGNALKGLEAGNPENLTKITEALMNAAALSAGPGEFRPGIAVASKAAEEVANYLSSASIEEKAAIALGANPKLLGDMSFNPGNEKHIKLVNEALAQISATAAETSRGAAVARFANGQRVETPYAATQGLLGPYAPGSLMSQTSPLQFPGGSFQQRMQWYKSQTPGQRAVEGPIPGAYARAIEARIPGLGFGPAYQKSYIQSRNRLETEAAEKSYAQQQFVESANASAKYSSVQSKLNLIVQDGSIQFGHLSQALTSTGSGFTVSTINALKFAAAIAVGQQITGSIVGAFEHLKGGIIGFNAMLESASVGFNTLFKNSGRSIKEAEQETSKTITTLRDFANVTNFRFGDLETAALRMQAFGFEVDTAKASLKGQMPVLYEIKNVITEAATGTKTFAGALVNIGDAVAALGGEDDKLRRITYALGQMNSAGRVYQNDMMQLANAGIAGYDILAKALLQEIEASPELKKANAAIYNKLMNPATAVEEVRRLAKTGKLFGPGAVQAILAGLAERYGGGMKAFSRTFAGALTTVADTSQSLVATSFNPLFVVVRDLTIELADFLQTAEATSAATGFSQTISKIADAIKKGLPSAISMVNKVVSSVLDTFGKLAGSAASGKSSLGGFISSTVSGFSAIADVLQNEVIRNFGATLVTAKLVLGFIASNPLLATIGASTAALGLLSNAIKTNQYGLGDAFNQISGPLQETLGNVGRTLIPSISESLTAAAAVMGRAIATLVVVFAPLVQVILEVVKIASGVLKPFSGFLGIVLALFIGKKIIIDGVASAMARFAISTEKAALSLAGMKLSMFALAEFKAMTTFGQNTFTATTSKAVFDKKTGDLIRPGQTVAGATGGPGEGLTGPGIYKIVNSYYAEQAAKAGYSYRVLNREGKPVENLTGAEKIAQENTPIPWGVAKDPLAALKLLKSEDPAAYANKLKGVAPSEKLQLEEAMNAGIRNVVSGLDGFKASVAAVDGKFNKLKFISDRVVTNMGGVGSAALGFGVVLSGIGAMFGNQTISNFGNSLATAGTMAYGLSATFTTLKGIGLSGMASGLTMVIGALAVFGAALIENAFELQDKIDQQKFDMKRDVFTTNKSLDGKYMSDEDKTKLAEMRAAIKDRMLTMSPLDFASGVDKKLEAMMAQYNDFFDSTLKDAHALRMESFTGKGSVRYRYEKDRGDISEYAIRGFQPEEIARLMNKPLDYIKSIFASLVEEGGIAGTAVTKILTSQLDATGEALKKAQDLLEKATTAFERPLGRLTTRIQTLIAELFADEKEKLEEAKNAALANIEVLYGGETIRLGVLQEQYEVLSAQKKEMEEMQKLEDLRTKASEAALGMFDAGTDPLERARAARDAARQLFSEGEQMRLDSMASTIESAKKSVPYTATSDDYDQRVKALEVDQQERQRVLTETIDDLMRKVKNGKLTADEAKKMLYDAFSQTGLDLSVAAAQGYDFMDSFSSGFMSALKKNIDRTFKALPGFLMSALNVLAEDKLYKKAQDTLNDILNPKPSDLTVSGTDMTIAQQEKINQAKRLRMSLREAETKPGQSKEQIKLLTDQMAKLTGYINTMEGNKYSPTQMYTEQEKTALGENFSAIAKSSFAALEDYFNPSVLWAWVFRALGMGRSGDGTNRASGGSVGAGTYMVGERGPEMLQMFPNGGGYVVPNHKLPSGMRSSAAALGGGIMGRAWGGGVGPVNPDAPGQRWLQELTDPATRFVHQSVHLGGRNNPGGPLGQFTDPIKLLGELWGAGVKGLMSSIDLRAALQTLAGQGKLPASLASLVGRFTPVSNLSNISGWVSPRLDFELHPDNPMFKNGTWREGNLPLSVGLVKSIVGGLAGDYEHIAGLVGGGTMQEEFLRDLATRSISFIGRSGAGKTPATSTTFGDALSGARSLWPIPAMGPWTTEQLGLIGNSGLQGLLPQGGGHGASRWAEFQIPGGLQLSEIETILGLSRRNENGDPMTPEETAKRAKMFADMGFTDLGLMAVATDVLDSQMGEWRSSSSALSVDDAKFTESLNEIKRQMGHNWQLGGREGQAIGLLRAGKLKSVEEAAHWAATFDDWVAHKTSILSQQERIRRAGFDVSRYGSNAAELPGATAARPSTGSGPMLASLAPIGPFAGILHHVDAVPGSWDPMLAKIATGLSADQLDQVSQSELWQNILQNMGTKDYAEVASMKQFLEDPNQPIEHKLALIQRFPELYKKLQMSSIGSSLKRRIFTPINRDGGGPVVPYPTPTPTPRPYTPPTPTPRPYTPPTSATPENPWSFNWPDLGLRSPYILDRRATGLGNAVNAGRTMSPYMSNLSSGVVKGGTGWSSYFGGRPLPGLQPGQLGTWKGSPTGKVGPLMSVAERGKYNVLSKGSALLSGFLAMQDIASSTENGEPIGRAVMRNIFGVGGSLLGGLMMAGSGVATALTGGAAIPTLIASIAASTALGTAGEAFGGGLYDFMDSAFGSSGSAPFSEIIKRQGFPGLWRHTKGQYGKDIFTPYSPSMPIGGHRAFGGKVNPFIPYMVGENGPELMVPGSLGGSIIPNHKLRGPGNIGSMASGQSVNASVIINNPTVSNSADIDKLAAKVSEAQTRALRAAGYVRPS